MPEVDGAGCIRSRNVSIRFAYQLFAVSESCYRYQPKLNEENQVIADWLLRITDSQRNWGGPVFFVPAQCKRPAVQPQKGVPDLIRVVAEHAHQTQKTTEAG